jgi:hypothetical protein
VDIRCDKGAYVGILKILDFDLLQPFVVNTKTDFKNFCNKLKGFNEISKTFFFENFCFFNNNNNENKNLKVEIETLKNQLLLKIKKLLNLFVLQDVDDNEILLSGFFLNFFFLLVQIKLMFYTFIFL